MTISLAADDDFNSGGWRLRSRAAPNPLGSLRASYWRFSASDLPSSQCLLARVPRLGCNARRGRNSSGLKSYSLLIAPRRPTFGLLWRGIFYARSSNQSCRFHRLAKRLQDGPGGIRSFLGAKRARELQPAGTRTYPRGREWQRKQCERRAGGGSPRSSEFPEQPRPREESPAQAPSTPARHARPA
jgi:hypothetical protein